MLLRIYLFFLKKRLVRWVDGFVESNISKPGYFNDGDRLLDVVDVGRDLYHLRWARR